MTVIADSLGSELVLATNNQGKIAEFELLFATLARTTKIIPQGQLQIADAEENALSFVENALIKARHAAKISGRAAIADDSGLVVPILQGAPGIYSARYAGAHGDDAANNAKLLAELLPLRQANQPISAMFVCVLALVRHAEDPLPLICQGIWQGEILTAPRGEHGFGYDPLFWLADLACTSAELSKADKNQISHRGRAMQQLKHALLSPT
jgi:XTP/dITP diphosphohydrolase